MNVRTWKRIAEKEVLHYKEHLAFQKGVEDAGGERTERYRTSKRWTDAVDAVCAHLHRNDPEKERFFRAYCGIGEPRIKRRNDSAVSVAMRLNISTSTLYKWRGEVLTLVLLAAAQNGVLKPFRKQ
ncbi:MAG: hypothetical protein IJJ86_01630 [Clostridia bacterium]|nr:hypothetical protein [Clostridia bacterium]